MKKILLLHSLFIISIGAIGQTQLDSSFGNNGIARAFFPTGETISVNLGQQVIAHPDGSFFILVNVAGRIYLNHRFANGAIDMNYGKDGYSVPFIMSGGHAALLPGGKMIVGGGTSAYGAEDFVIVQYNADGRLDKTFADDGKRIIDFSGSDFLNDITIQSDGKILAVGSYNSDAGFAIARLNNDGSFDNSFSGDGKQTTFFTSSSGANSAAVGSDGRIFVTGSVAGSMAVAAYLHNGDIDSSFAEYGMTKFKFGDNDAAKTIAIQTDGKFVLLGNTSIQGVSGAVIFRLDAGGALDAGFSGDGKEIMILPNYGSGEDMAIDQEGKILVAVEIRDGIRVATLARFTSAGLPDSSFSEDGIATLNVGNIGAEWSLAIQRNAKILVAGLTVQLAGTNYFAARFNSDGTPDYTLDDDGIVSGYVKNGFTEFHAAAIQADGKIVCAGVARTMGLEWSFVIARFNSDGSLDPGFSQDGWVTIRFEPIIYQTNFFYSEAHGIAIQPDGKIIVVGQSMNVGQSLNGPNNNYAVARLNVDGSMDSSFSGDGKLLTDLFGAEDYANAVAIQPDGKIVVAGSSVFGEGSANFDFSLVRYNPDGSLDNSFSWDGKQTTEFFSGADKVSKVIIQPDGKILAVGSGGSPDGPWTTRRDFALARYLPNGYPDNSFGYDGAIKIDFQSFEDAASDAFLFADGSILVGGTAGDVSNGSRHFAVAKLRSNGFLDSSFANNGEKIVPLGFSSETCNAMGVQSNGSIVLGGTVSNSPSPTSDDIGMIRLFADGTPDNSFSFGGKYFMDLGATEETIKSINIQNNRIYAIGSTWDIGRVGFIMAFKLNCSLSLNIPDAFAMPFGVDPNTVYTGYAPADDLTLTARANGNQPFTYKWNTGANTKSIHVSPNSTTTYSVAVTDALGCTQQASKAVNVVDVRCGPKGEKVLICQVQHGKWEKRKTICVDVWSATAFLLKGSHLGSCPSEDLSSANFSSAVEEKNTFGMVASPNPTYDQFALDIKLSETELAELIIRDIQGKIMERMTIHSTSLVRIGTNYAPGIYIAELRQAQNKLTIKLVKASR